MLTIRVLTLVFLLYCSHVYPQSVQEIKELQGILLDSDEKRPLPYANIVALSNKKGTITNEEGVFSIQLNDLKSTDTLTFQYVGYKTKNVTISELASKRTVYLHKETLLLGEAFVFAKEHDAELIIEKVIEHKEDNYQQNIRVDELFIRDKIVTDVKDVELEFKKSSFSELDKGLLESLESKIPSQTTSYTDFLGNIYINGSAPDTANFKIDPIKTVSLEDKNLTNLKEYESMFEDLFFSVDEDEYFKIKSGLFSVELDTNGSHAHRSDSSKSKEESSRSVAHFNRHLRYQLKYSLLEDTKDWEFLYKQGRYLYSLSGGTKINGEEAYVIDFKPRNKGRYEGTVYVSMDTYALIRADYTYAIGKKGMDIPILGLDYTEHFFKGLIYFEKKDDRYHLKYFSKKTEE